jgi:hypothetical protein
MPHRGGHGADGGGRRRGRGVWCMVYDVWCVVCVCVGGGGGG